MKVSTRTRYGIRATIELAGHYKQGPLQLRIIAERDQVLLGFLQVLRNASGTGDAGEE